MLRGNLSTTAQMQFCCTSFIHSDSPNLNTVSRPIHFFIFSLKIVHGGELRVI